MSNYEEFRDIVKQYFNEKGIDFSIETTLHDSSENNQATPSVFLYNGEREISVISMDNIAQRGYKRLREAPYGHNTLNTADAFLIDVNKEWYFIEFKDVQRLSKKKDNIEKKGMANWLMLMDIFFDIGIDVCSNIIDLSNPMEFARNHITYIVVCNSQNDQYTYEQVRNSDNAGEHYTPEFLNKFKDFFFKDAYVYTEQYFENRFVKHFKFE